MKQSIKHHLVNWKSGKTLCGLNFKKDSIRIAELDSGNWYNDFGDQLDTDNNWQNVFCMNCLKLHELDLIEQFKMKTFLIRYELALPKSNRLRKKRNSQLRSNRKNGIKSDSISKQLDSEFQDKSKSIPKTSKGKARAKKKQSNKSNPIIKSNSLTNKVMDLYPIPTESKCVIKSKPKSNPKKQSKPKSKPIKKNKPLLNKGDIIELTEEIPIDDSFRIGDPIEDDVLELGIGTNWKLVRHNKHLDLWKLQVKSINKKNKVSKWIDDTEYCPYDFISDIINSGYCE